MDVVTSLLAWRTHPKDEVGIGNIIRAKTERLFGKIDRLEMMEKSVVQVSLRCRLGDKTRG